MWLIYILDAVGIRKFGCLADMQQSIQEAVDGHEEDGGRRRGGEEGRREEGEGGDVGRSGFPQERFPRSRR